MRSFFLLTWLMFFTLANNAAAQSPEDIGQSLNGMSIELDAIDAALKREGLSDDQLLAQRLDAIEIGNRAQAIASALQPSITELSEQLEALQPNPEEATEIPPGEAPESTEIIRERDAIQSDRDNVEALAKRALAIGTRAGQLAERAAAIERDRFTRQIFEHDQSVIDPALWRTALADFPAAMSGISRVFSGIFNRFASKGVLGLLPPALFVLSLGLVVVPNFRHGLVNLVAARIGHDEATEMSRAVVACLVVLFVMLAPLAGFLLGRWTAELFDMDSPSLSTMMDRVGAAIVLMSASIGFARAILAPNRPDWRLADAGEADARALSRYVKLLAGIVAAGVVLQSIADAANMPRSLVVLTGGLIGLAFAWTLWLALKPYRSILSDAGGAVAADRMRYAGLLRFFGAAGTLAMMVIVAAVLLGFIPLAWFLSKQVVWISIVFASYALLSNLFDAISEFAMASDSAMSERLSRLTGMKRSSVAQFSIVAFGLAKLLLVVMGLIAVAAPWGFRSAGMFEQAKLLLTGFEIGGISISLSTIAGGIFVFTVGILITRTLQAWLNGRLLPATSLDAGLKNSISTTFGYLGFIAAVVVAFGFVGIDLSQLGLVAGALSVGIGFGLQSIVNNFVSGLILLAERPIKAGDWIIVGGEEGTVKKINVRATELETFDRASVVIPNSDLISGTVRNWVLGGTMGRSSLVVGVGYGSDADQVREVLLACASEHELVLTYPEPGVFFLDFGDSALVFRLDVYLSDIGNGFRVRSDLRFEILRRLREAGIEIPFPQRDLNIRSTQDAVDLIDRLKQD